MTAILDVPLEDYLALHAERDKLLEDKRRLVAMVERLLGILNEWPVEQAAVPYGYGYALPEARALLAELEEIPERKGP